MEGAFKWEAEEAFRRQVESRRLGDPPVTRLARLRRRLLSRKAFRTENSVTNGCGKQDSRQINKCSTAGGIRRKITFVRQIE